MKVFKEIPSESVDLIFTDPPFNIGKKYDEYKDTQDLFDYYNWCYLWIDECMRVLKPTGQIYIMNFPRHLAFLHQYLIKSGWKYLILDCFAGSGTTLVVAKQLNRKYIGIELSERYCKLIKRRLNQENLTKSEVKPTKSVWEKW